MIKKIVALLLSLVLVSSLSAQIVAYADMDSMFQANLFILANGEEFEEKVIIKKSTVFMNVNSFEKYTNYVYNNDESRFDRLGHDDHRLGYKSVLLDAKKGLLTIFYIKPGNQYKIKLREVIKAHDSYYLPLDQVLPSLNARAKVENGCLVIDSNGVSMADAMYGFDPNWFYSPMEDRAYSWGLYSFHWFPNYLFDTITKEHPGRIKSLTGGKSDYRDVLINLLTDDSVYLKAVSGDENSARVLTETISNLLGLKDAFSDTFKSAEMCADKILTENDGKIKVFNEVYDVNKMTKEAKAELEKYNEILDVVDVISLVTDYGKNFITYSSVIEDHRNMMESVYKESESNAFIEEYMLEFNEYQAAEEVIKDFSGAAGKQTDALYAAFKDVARDKTMEELVEAIAPQKIIAKTTGFFIENVCPWMQSSDSVALLPTIIDVKESCRRAIMDHYYCDEEMTDERSENLRLSTIMYLLAYKEYYQTYLDWNESVEKSIFANDTDLNHFRFLINQYDARLALLYQAADSVELDSTEHYKEHAKELKKQLAGLIDELKPTEASNNWTENEILSAYRDYFYENYDSNTDKVYICDVTTDGIGEMMVVSPLDDETYLSKPYLLYVYTLLSDGTIVQIYSADESNAMHTRHVIGICEYGSNNCLYELDDYVWTGWGSFSQSIFLLDQNGNKNVLMLNGGTIEDGILVDGDNRFKDYTDVMDIVRKPEEVFGPLNISTDAGEGSVRNVQVTCDDASLKATAFDNNGRVVWNYSIESSDDLWFPELEYEVVDGVAVFISDASTRSIIAVDYATGEEMWTHNVEYDSSGAYYYEYGYGSGADLAYHGGTLYFCCEDSGVVCLAIDGNGREKWRVDAPDGFWGAYKIEVSDEYVVTYSCTQEVDSFYYAQRFNFSGEEIGW